MERFDLDEALKRYRDEKLPRCKQSWSWAWVQGRDANSLREQLAKLVRPSPNRDGGCSRVGTAIRFGLGFGLGLVSESVSCLLIRIALQE